MNFLTALGWITLGAIALMIVTTILLVFIVAIVAIKVAFEKERDASDDGIIWQKDLWEDIKEQEQDDEAKE